MPWKECHVVDERLRFIARLLDGENAQSSADWCLPLLPSCSQGRVTESRSTQLRPFPTRWLSLVFGLLWVTFDHVPGPLRPDS
jgi:hypothetical protein